MHFYLADKLTEIDYEFDSTNHQSNRNYSFKQTNNVRRFSNSFAQQNHSLESIFVAFPFVCALL